MVRNKVYEEREELVVKSNELITKTRYELTAVEQKIVIYMISKIKKDDTNLELVEMSISDYLKVCGENTGGTNYEYIKTSLENLSNKSWWINTGHSNVLFRWVDTAEIDQNTHKLKIRLSYSLRSYLVELQKNFTSYQLVNVLALKSKYAIRIYEILKSREWMGHWIVSMTELRELLQVTDKYKAIKDFKKYVLDCSIKEINEFTDLIVTYEQVKDGRTIAELKFKIREKRGFEEFIQHQANVEKRLK